MSTNIPLFLAYVLSLLMMIGLPIFLAIFFVKKFKVSWWVVLTGVLTFLISQGLRIPASAGINALFQNGTLSITNAAFLPIVNGIIVGLMAGLFEETTRWAGFKVLRRKAEKYGSALALGAGHGGIESILIAVLGVATTLVTVLFFNAGGQIAKGVSTEQVQYMLAQIQQFWMTPWHLGLLSGVERVIALSTQIFLSTLVWKAVVDREFIWWGLAVLYHMVVDALAVFLSQKGWGYWPIEGILAIFMIFNVYMIYRFWKDESELEKEMEEITEEELAELDEDEEGDEDEDFEDGGKPEVDDNDEEDEDIDDESTGEPDLKKGLIEGASEIDLPADEEK